MDRVIVYVDGFNLYYGLRSKGWKRFYWLDIQSSKKHHSYLSSGPVIVRSKTNR